MEYFLKHQQIILRVIGGFLLLSAFIIHFWTVPQKRVSPNDRAAANLARMEASVEGKGRPKQGAKKSDSSKFLKELKNQQEKQMEYLVIFTMLLGVGALGYSFFKKKKSDT